MQSNDFTMEDKEVTVYSSRAETLGFFFRQIWKYRNLILVFAQRDLKVKYAQTFIGLGWTVLQPLTALFIYTFFFGFLLNWKTDGIDYPVYVLSGLLGWNYFSYIVNSGAFGIQESAHLIKKIYFPKSIIPLSKTLTALVELGISLLLLVLLLIYFGQSLSWKIIFLPLVLLYNTVCGLCLVFWISVLATKKRDVLHLVPFLMYFGIWFSPVFFGSDLLPEQYKFVLDFNPMANVVELWRWSLFDFGAFKWIWVINFFIVMLFFMSGLYFYNRKESKLTDYL